MKKKSLRKRGIDMQGFHIHKNQFEIAFFMNKSVLKSSITDQRKIDFFGIEVDKKRPK